MKILMKKVSGPVEESKTEETPKKIRNRPLFHVKVSILYGFLDNPEQGHHHHNSSISCNQHKWKLLLPVLGVMSRTVVTHTHKDPSNLLYRHHISFVSSRRTSKSWAFISAIITAVPWPGTGRKNLNNSLGQSFQSVLVVIEACTRRIKGKLQYFHVLPTSTYAMWAWPT